jgi:hypothetical protein
MNAKLAALTLTLTLALLGVGWPPAVAGDGAARCGMQAAERPCAEGEPCRSFAAMSCCDVAPALPGLEASRPLDGSPSTPALAPHRAEALPPRAIAPARAASLAHATSSLRLSVVLRS